MIVTGVSFTGALQMRRLHAQSAHELLDHRCRHCGADFGKNTNNSPFQRLGLPPVKSTLRRLLL